MQGKMGYVSRRADGARPVDLHRGSGRDGQGCQNDWKGSDGLSCGLRESPPVSIVDVSVGFLDTLSLDGGETECLGLFICRGGEEFYTAMNNQYGQRWREDFRTRRTACLWLQGHMCLNHNNELCNGETGEKILDVAERVRAESERDRK